MSLLSTWRLTKDDDFRGRVCVAVYSAGLDILNSDEDQNSVRYKMALEAKNQNEITSIDFIWPLANNSTISGKSEQGASTDVIPDSDIQYVVSSVWNEVAALRYRTDSVVPSVVWPEQTVPVA